MRAQGFDKSENMASRAFKRGTHLQRADKKVAIKENTLIFSKDFTLRPLQTG